MAKALSTPHVAEGTVGRHNAAMQDKGRPGLIGAFLPVVYNVFFSAIVAGVVQAAYEHEMGLVLWPTQHEHAREVSLLDVLTSGATDGALMILPQQSNEELVRLLDGSCPFVVVNPRLPLDGRVPCVSAAHRSGADQAMQHLLALGHRRVAAITGPPGRVATEDRRIGYRTALAAAGIERDPALEVEADFQFEPGANAAGSLLDLPEPPTAIFAFSDTIAIGAIDAARERGVRVPEDLSIVGFDDSQFATVVAPRLTTVRQPLAQMGRTGVGLLVRLLEKRRPGPVQIELPTRLVVRGSTGPPK